MFAKSIEMEQKQALATAGVVALPSTPRHEVEVQTSLGEFCALAHEWDAVGAAAAGRSVFNNWMWHYAWWDEHRQKRILRLLVARRLGVATAIAPFYVDSARKCGVPVRVLRLLGTAGDGNPYDVGPLIRAESAPASARALAEALLRMDGYDVLELADLEAANPFAAELLRVLDGAALRVEVRRTQRLLRLALPTTWNAYLQSLASEQRARLRHRRHAFLAAKRPRFVAWHTGTSVEGMLGVLTELRRLRSQRRDGIPGCSRSALAEALRENRLRLYWLEVRGRAAAAACAMRVRDRIVVLQSESDPQYREWHPVSVLMQYAVESAIAERASALDFLRGQQDFDDELFPGDARIAITAFRSPVAGAAFRANAALTRRRSAR